MENFRQEIRWKRYSEGLLKTTMGYVFIDRHSTSILFSVSPYRSPTKAEQGKFSLCLISRNASTARKEVLSSVTSPSLYASTKYSEWDNAHLRIEIHNATPDLQECWLSQVHLRWSMLPGSKH